MRLAVDGVFHRKRLHDLVRRIVARAISATGRLVAPASISFCTLAVTSRVALVVAGHSVDGLHHDDLRRRRRRGRERLAVVRHGHDRVEAAGCRPEDDEHRFGRFEIERHAGHAVLLLPGSRELHAAAFRPPELGPLALHAEAARAGDRCLALVGHEVKLRAVFQRAVDIAELAGQAAVTGEIDGHFHAGQDLLGRFAPDDAALAQRVLA